MTTRRSNLLGQLNPRLATVLGGRAFRSALLGAVVIRGVVTLAGCAHRDEDVDTATPALEGAAALVISQVYAGPAAAAQPANPDAGLVSDRAVSGGFIELLNRGAAPAPLAGRALSFLSNKGKQTIALPDVVLLPNQYFLIGIGEQPAAANGATLPDFAEGTTGFRLANVGAAGLIEKPPPEKPTEVVTIDLVGYGPVPPPFFKGSAPAPAITDALAAVRRNGGCQDSKDNANDFESAPPAPRNSKSVSLVHCQGAQEADAAAEAEVPPTNTPDATVVDPPDASDASVVVVGDDGGTLGPIKGEKGDKGDPGAPGAPGTPGAKGDPGAAGATGDAGATGATGAAGAKGDTGKDGKAGGPGVAGEMGGSGATGAAGAPGKNGANGKEGSCSTAPVGSTRSPMGAFAALALALTTLGRRKRARRTGV